MKIAIFTDIHGNVPALKSILDDIKKNALNELSEKDIEEGINLYNSFEVEKKEE